MYVAFVDILGFGSAIEELNLREHQQLRRALETGRLPASSKPGWVYRRYADFREEFARQLQGAEEFGKLLKLRKGPIAILFSDSAFFASSHPAQTLTFAEGLVTMLYYQHVPVRAGIGAGSFSLVDVSLNSRVGGAQATAAFLGSAVVRAYRAESSGVKGLRVLVHPSACQGLHALRGVQLEPLPVHETTIHATHEVNLVHGGTGLAESLPHEVFKLLTDMEQQVPENVRDHYSATRAAIHRMVAPR